MNTQNNRSKVKLLKFLRRKLFFRIFPSYGLCSFIDSLYETGELSLSERTTLRRIIYDNRPPESEGRLYWWNKDRKRPRMKFLKMLINKYGPERIDG